MSSKSKKQRIIQALKEGKITDQKSLEFWLLMDEIGNLNLVNDLNERVRKFLDEVEVIKGEKGDSPTDAELLGLIRPLIPSPIKGDKGDPGRPGKDGKSPTDKELLAIIKPLILSIDLPKAEDIAKLVPQPKVPTMAEITDNIPIEAEKIRDALELLIGEERLDASAIRNLPEATEKIIERIGGNRGINTYVSGSKKGLINTINFVGPTHSKVNGRDTLTFPSGSVSDEAYGAGWDGVTDVAPSKNAVYDKIETLPGGHDAVTLDANADTLLSLSTQELGLDTQTANTVFAGPTSGAAAVPTFRALGADDIPALPYAASDHDATHAVGGTDTVFPVDPGADKYLKWDDDPGALVWADAPAPEGTAVLSTGETGGTKFLREDGDGTCSWQTIAADTDEKVKYDAGDPTAGYVADKIVAGIGINIAEGTGATENKLVITSSITQATRDSLGLDTDDTVTFANLSGTNTGDNAANTSIAATKLDDFATPDDNTDLNANTTNHGLLLKATAPTAGLTNVVAIENGETVYKNKALFDATDPSTQAFGDSAAVGSAVVAARRDHKHAMPANPVTAQEVGFTIAAGTTPKTLTVALDASVSGTNTGDQDISGKADTSGSLTQFVGNTAWRVFYSNADGDITELALGADGTYLKSNGASAAPTFAAPAGGGDVSKVGTPADNQVGVWTGDGTIEGTSGLTYDGSNFKLTGDIGATASRITKIWGTDIESTNMPTVGGTPVLSSLTAPQFTTIELGHASDTTLSRVSAGVVAIEGVNVLTTAGGTLTGNLTLGENTSIALDPAGSADGKYSGITVAGTAGAALAFGDLVYLAAADSRWELADANAASTSGNVMLGMCVLEAAGDGSATTILLHGIIRADTAFPALTISAQVYASTTAGDIQVAQPTGTDDVIRVVGRALTADEIYFNPSEDYITHT